MQFEDQSTAVRQMKELLRDQAKFRAKLDRVVRKIETSSERTAKLAERNKARSQKMNGKPKKKPAGHAAVEQQESEKIHGDKIHGFDPAKDGHGNDGHSGDGSGDGQAMNSGSEQEMAISAPGASYSR